MLFRLHQNQSTAMLQKKHPNDQRVFPVTHDSASHSASRFHSYRYHMQKLRFCEKWVERAPLKFSALLPKLSYNCSINPIPTVYQQNSPSFQFSDYLPKDTFHTLQIYKGNIPLFTDQQRKLSAPYCSPKEAFHSLLISKGNT